ncbi:DUF2515 family protein [Neobacillus thermocopriae]|uniref:DUF2515 family protein n=1 Tax=Neobacillus thermocopriae TaxID=1215031 RepID=UPI002E1C7463|nr:DUF2515 family protein [Neobacillus thermocopriae]MED3712778.1 DUF2515 family protein [Neobacillus thermocopriae]
MNDLTIQEQNLIRQIRFETDKRNMDNISRTNAYFSYFKNNRDILWAFLASMVSRNGGWNMCDLEGSIFRELLAPEYRKQLFLVFERANWLIFHDVYPQLLIYQYSREMNRPMFHLLPYFHVSSFIQKEWYKYWKEKDRFRLMTALIINEQNVIQTPVIDHPLLKKRVFRSLMFQFQDWLHFSCVLFPTTGGEVYGASVNGFRSLYKRINLGKRLANILFHPRLFPHFFEFAEKTSHTGSRNYYEQYFKVKTGIKTPILRMTYPIIEHQQNISNDWSKKRKVPSIWMKYPVKHRNPIHLTDWYIEKSNQLMLLLSFHKVFHLKKWE